ncbi:hypothetical protein B0H14DRAFT_2579428 [Mycena olivaceomarginata]|nr:hypothetical protein B0H14DRAFT_2579428 [Mycena olivaceomarginata]
MSLRSNADCKQIGAISEGHNIPIQADFIQRHGKGSKKTRIRHLDNDKLEAQSHPSGKLYSYLICDELCTERIRWGGEEKWIVAHSLRCFDEVDLWGTNTKRNRAAQTSPPEWGETASPTNLTQEESNVGGVASSMAAHILGYSGRAACPHASQKAIAEATKSQASTKARKDGGTAAVPVTAKRSHATVNANAVAGSSSSAVLRPNGPAKKQKQGHFEVISKQKSTYEPDERAAIEMQATRAIISTGSAFGLFEDVEMKKLFDMIRDGTGDIMQL